jgi:hypothetical protein
MDRVLADLKRAGYIILRVKSQFCMPRLRIIRFIYNTLRRYLNIFKIIKIVKWPFPNNIIEVKTFIRVTIYYKIFIKNFTIIAVSIYSLIRKRIRFI